MFWWPLTLPAYLMRLVTAVEERNSPTLSQQHPSHSGNISLSIINATFQIPSISQSCDSRTLFMHGRWRGAFRDAVQYHRPVGRNHSLYCSHAGGPTGCLTGCKVTHGHYISLNKTRSAAWAEGSVLLAFEERCAAKRQLTLLLYPDSQWLPFPPRCSTQGGADMLLSHDRRWAPTVHA